MGKVRFTGKIRTDPWDSLAYGPKEVMAAIWGEYLQELLEGPPKSGRVRRLRQDIEAAGDYPRIYREWPGMPPERRAEAWRQLVRAAREHYEALKDRCVRCGECCEKDSPTLLVADLPLFTQEVLTWHEVYTLRPGEQATSPEGIVITLNEERLKVRELPGSRQCYYYQAATHRCRIYEQRPEQCRRWQCWGEPPPPPDAKELLTRRHLFGQVPEIWELITAHQERCDLVRVRDMLTQLSLEEERLSETLFEALHFDHYLRRLLVQEWGLKPAATELLLGRPVTEFLRTLGIKAALTPEGVFSLEPLR